MSNERITKEFTTSNGNKIVALDYLTGREVREINNIREEKGNNEAMDHAFNLVFKSIDGITENVLNVALDLPSTTYTEMLNHLVTVIDPKKKLETQSHPTSADN